MLKKIITTTFLFLLLAGNFCFLQTSPVNAQDFKSQVTMGDFKAGEEVHIDGNTLGKYIKEIYKYSIGFVGILATVVMMFGGFLWITAGGNGERVGNAKAWIGSALTGLLLALCSWTILYIVNPSLVNFASIDVATPKQNINSENCSWKKLAINQYCPNGYISKDGSHCEGSIGDNNTCCCISDDTTDSDDIDTTITHSECMRQENMAAGGSITYIYKCMTAMGAGTNECSEDTQCNITNSSY